ncbi:MAG: hypothetical protein Q8S13_07495 [Dehalococcoidia bacterium]|nr:hypothetical protein [Dehalococcoidia bacterium]
MDPPPGGGSHWKVTRLKDGKSYPIVAHNGTKSEIGKNYIRGLRSCFQPDLDDL